MPTKAAINSTLLPYVETRLTKAKAETKKFHDQIEHYRSLYGFKHYTGAQAATEIRYEDPTYTNVVDTAVGILLANPIRFKVQGWKLNEMEEEETSKIEKFLTGLVQLNDSRNEYSTEYETTMGIVRDGVTVLHSVWDRRLHFRHLVDIDVPDETNPQGAVRAKGLMEPPITLEVIDPKEIHMVQGGPHRWQTICRITKRTVLDIESEFGIELEGFKGMRPENKADMEVDFTDFWEISSEISEDEKKAYTAAVEQAVASYQPTPPPPGEKIVVRNAILVNNRFIPGYHLKDMPGYDAIPYTIGFFKPVDRKKSEDWSHSIIRPMESTINLLARSINRRARQIDVFSQLDVFFQPVNPGRTLEMDPGVGQVHNLQPGERVDFMKWPGNPPDVEEQINYLRSKLQQSGFSDVMFGTASGDTGYALSQMGDQNRIRLNQPVRHLELMWKTWAEKVLKLLERHAPDIYVRVYGEIRGKFFKENILGAQASKYGVIAEVKPEFPNEQVRQHAMATQVRGLLPDSVIMEKYLGIEQPDDVKDRMLQEAIEKHPAVIQYNIMKSLRARQEAGDQDAGIILQQLSQGNIMGSPGRPNEPPNPAQKTGTQSPGGSAENPAAPRGQSPLDQISGMAEAAPGMMGTL